MKIVFFLSVFFLLGFIACENIQKAVDDINNNILSLDELSAKWVLPGS